jgi:protein tyrosine phosphatase (PTP) superfamily phosphohydrolase (DUF442 family)
MRTSRLRRWLVSLGVVVLIGLLPISFVLWRYSTSNLGALQPGRIQRSGQMSANRLTATIEGSGVRTVLNLRGVNENDAWYLAERNATTAAGAIQVDFKMASDQWLSRAQLRALIRIFDSSEYPLLIHCESGSERTGLASAIAELLRPDGSVKDARTQFSRSYLFVRDAKNKVLPEHLEQYEAWLHARGWNHSPDRFRQWAAEGFVPGQPSREYWPFNPDPLVVITRPRTPAAIRSVPDKTRR